MQTCLDVINNAIEFTTPDRLPVIFDAFGISDVKGVNWNQIGTGDHSQRLTYDEWGCGWSRSDMKNMGLVNVHPLDSWDKLDAFRWPNPDNPAFYAGMERHFEHSDGMYLLTGIFMLL